MQAKSGSGLLLENVSEFSIPDCHIQQTSETTVTGFVIEVIKKRQTHRHGKVGIECTGLSDGEATAHRKLNVFITYS